MAKNFLDVFPDLHMTSEMEELFKLVEVERISAPRNRSSLRIYIVSPRLIHRKNLYDLERGIKEQLFPGKQLEVRIVEKYRLSGQYTPEKLLNVYKDSLLLELKHYSILLYNIMRKAQCTFPRDQILSMTVEDNPVLKQKTGELKRILEKVFCERCGLPVEVTYQFVEAKEEKQSLLREAQLQREIEERLRNSPLAAQSLSSTEAAGSLEVPGAPGVGNAGIPDGGTQTGVTAAGGATAGNGKAGAGPEGKTAAMASAWGKGGGNGETKGKGSFGGAGN